LAQRRDQEPKTQAGPIRTKELVEGKPLKKKGKHVCRTSPTQKERRPIKVGLLGKSEAEAESRKEKARTWKTINNIGDVGRWNSLERKRKSYAVEKPVKEHKKKGF